MSVCPSRKNNCAACASSPATSTMTTTNYIICALLNESYKLYAVITTISKSD